MSFKFGINQNNETIEQNKIAVDVAESQPQNECGSTMVGQTVTGNCHNIAGEGKTQAFGSTNPTQAFGTAKLQGNTTGLNPALGTANTQQIYGTQNQQNSSGSTMGGQTATFGNWQSTSRGVNTQGLGSTSGLQFGEQNRPNMYFQPDPYQPRVIYNKPQTSNTGKLGATNINVDQPITIIESKENSFNFGMHQNHTNSFSNKLNFDGIGTTNINVYQPITITDCDISTIPAQQPNIEAFRIPHVSDKECLSTTNITVIKPITISARDAHKYFPNGVPQSLSSYTYRVPPINYSNKIGNLTSTNINVQQPIIIKGHEEPTFKFGIFPTTDRTQQQPYRSFFTEACTRNDGSMSSTNITVEKPITINGLRRFSS